MVTKSQIETPIKAIRLYLNKSQPLETTVRKGKGAVIHVPSSLPELSCRFSLQLPEMLQSIAVH